MNDFKEMFSTYIHSEGKYRDKLHGILEQFFFPPLPQNDFSVLNAVRALYHGRIHGDMEYELSPFPYYGFIHTSAGSSKLLYDTETYTLCENSIAFLDFSNGCRLRIDSTDFFEHTLVIIDGTLCPFYYRLFYQKRQAVSFLPPNSNITNRIKTLHILAQSAASEESDFLIAHKLITDLLTSMILEQNFNPRIRDAVPNHVLSALSYINAHYSESISLDLLSEIVHISKYTLSHDFTKYMKVSVMDYVCSQRIEQTKHLLSTTSLSVSEISYQLGFSSDAHLVSTFKKKVGITPLQYRKQHNTHTYHCD